jgi:hypothetical protein
MQFPSASRSIRRLKSPSTVRRGAATCLAGMDDPVLARSAGPSPRNAPSLSKPEQTQSFSPPPFNSPSDPRQQTSAPSLQRRSRILYITSPWYSVGLSPKRARSGDSKVPATCLSACRFTTTQLITVVFSSSPPLPPVQAEACTAPREPDLPWPSPRESSG